MWWKKKHLTAADSRSPTYCMCCHGVIADGGSCLNCTRCQACGKLYTRSIGGGCPDCAKPKYSGASAIALQLQKAMPTPYCALCNSPQCSGTCLANAAPGSLTYAALQRALGALADLPVTSPVPEKLPIDLEKLSQLEKAEPRKVLARTPDLVEVITAYRAWAVVNDKLKGIGSDVRWEPKKKQVAACCNILSAAMGNYGRVTTCHASPRTNCTCGFWGFKTLDLLLQAANNENYRNIAVLGKVSLWGRVIECEFGFRAEFAYPAEIWGLNLDAAQTEELGLAYGVPVRTL